MDGTPRLVHWTSVVRVRPRTSRSITDLLLALACVHLVNMHGTREKQHTRHSQTGNPRAPVGLASRPTGQVFRPTSMRDRGLSRGRGLTRYRNQPDKSLHQSGAAMHHRPEDQERTLNLSIPTAS